MKKYLFLFIMIVNIMIFTSCSANASAEDDFMWTEDYALALQNAKETGRSILMNFTGSDWCVWCIRLKNEVFSQQEFMDYAEANLILFKADFPNKLPQSDELKMQNQTLAQKHHIEGFPTIVLIDSSENVLARTGYQQGGAAPYVKHIETLLGKE